MSICFVIRILFDLFNSAVIFIDFNAYIAFIHCIELYREISTPVEPSNVV